MTEGPDRSLTRPLGILVAVALVGAGAWVLWMQGDTTPPSDSGARDRSPIAGERPDPAWSVPGGAVVPGEGDADGGGALEDPAAVGTITSSQGPVPPEIPEPPASLTPVEVLQSLLPAWMAEDVAELRSEQVYIVDTWVSRSRGRYKWDGKISMEMEITDLGENYPEHLPASLGFNPAMESEETETGFFLATEIENCLINQEYDAEALEGSIQLFVANRLLVEIQLEQLPLESFNTVLSAQVPLEDLVALAQKRAAEAR